MCPGGDWTREGRTFPELWFLLLSMYVGKIHRFDPSLGADVVNTPLNEWGNS